MTRPAVSAAPLLLLGLGLVLACGEDTNRGQGLTARDSSDIEAVRTAYEQAWLADDTLGVLATLHPDAVLLPPGRLPLKGEREIRAFWWPTDGSRTTVMAFDWTLDEMVGAGGLAFTRGISTVEWRYEKDTVRAEQTTRSTNLTILVRGTDGRWRILRQMWGPPLAG
jgi:ketosteroid isomerase-like protein